MQVVCKILRLLNIQADENQKWILLSLAASGLLITYANPTISKQIITDLPARWLAIESLVGSVSSLLVGMVWKGKVRKTVIRLFTKLCIAECTAGFLLAMYLCFISYNSWVFAISSLIYTSIITEFVAKCILMFKSKLWNEREREIYDNNHSIMLSLTCVIGYGSAIICLPSLKLSCFLWGVVCVIDDIGWLIVYMKNKDKLME